MKNRFFSVTENETLHQYIPLELSLTFIPLIRLESTDFFRSGNFFANAVTFNFFCFCISFAFSCCSHKFQHKTMSNKFNVNDGGVDGNQISTLKSLFHITINLCLCILLIRPKCWEKKPILILPIEVIHHWVWFASFFIIILLVTDTRLPLYVFEARVLI